MDTECAYYVLLTSISNHGTGELGTCLADVWGFKVTICREPGPITDYSRRLPSKRARAMYRVHPLRSSPKGTALSGISLPSVKTWMLASERDGQETEASHTQTRGTEEPCLLNCSVLLRAASSHSSFWMTLRGSTTKGVMGLLPYSDSVLVLSVTTVREKSAEADKGELLLRLAPREPCF